MLIKTDFAEIIKQTGVPSELITEEFCDPIISCLIDKFLFRKHRGQDDEANTFFTHSDNERIEFQNQLSAVDTTRCLAAFYLLQGYNINSNNISPDFFIKNCLSKMENRRNYEEIIKQMNVWYKRFREDLFIPFMEGKTDHPWQTFMNEIMYKIYDPDEFYNLNFKFDPHNIRLIQLIEKVKRVFLIYYVGGYPDMDKFSGLYTDFHRSPHFRTKPTQKTVAQLMRNDEVTRVFNQVFPPNIKVYAEKEIKSFMMITGDIVSFLAYCEVPFCERIDKAKNVLARVFEGHYAMFGNYHKIRGSSQGKLFLGMMSALMCEYRSMGGYVATYCKDENIQEAIKTRWDKNR